LPPVQRVATRAICGAAHAGFWCLHFVSFVSVGRSVVLLHLLKRIVFRCLRRVNNNIQIICVIVQSLSFGQQRVIYVHNGERCGSKAKSQPTMG
jgi:hypothetical protein